jgi:hypothetical protein
MFISFDRYNIQLRNPPYPRSQRQSVIKVKSCNALLRMLLACSCSYLKLVLRYKFLIFNTYHPDALHVHEQGCEGPRLFFENKSGSRAKTRLGNNAV